MKLPSLHFMFDLNSRPMLLWRSAASHSACEPMPAVGSVWPIFSRATITSAWCSRQCRRSEVISYAGRLVEGLAMATFGAGSARGVRGQHRQRAQLVRASLAENSTCIW